MLVPGTGSQDNGHFRIAGTRLESDATFDFEDRSSYAIRVRGADRAGAAADQVLVIAVMNVNEAPTLIDLSNASVAEGQPAPTIVGALSDIDPDAGDGATFALVPGAGSQDNGDFRTVGAVLVTAAVLDAGAQPTSAAIRVRVRDGGLTIDRRFVVTIAPADSRAVASVSFDDGLHSQYANARPALVRNGIPATFYVIGDALGLGGAYMDAAAVRQLAAEGAEIGNHARTHPDLATLAPTEIQAEFESGQATIASLAGVTPTTCAYPYGSYNAAVVAEAAKLFAACRTTDGGLNLAAGLQPHRLAVYNVTHATTADDIRAAIENAASIDAWVIFTYHGVLSDGSGLAPDSGDVTAAAFVEQMEAIRESAITVRTVSAALASRTA